MTYIDTNFNISWLLLSYIANSQAMTYLCPIDDKWCTYGVPVQRTCNHEHLIKMAGNSVSRCMEKPVVMVSREAADIYRRRQAQYVVETLA